MRKGLKIQLSKWYRSLKKHHLRQKVQKFQKPWGESKLWPVWGLEREILCHNPTKSELLVGPQSIIRSQAFAIPSSKARFLGTSLAVHWLKLHTSTAGDTDSTPDLATKIPICKAPSKNQNFFCKSNLYHILSICYIPWIVIKISAYYPTESSDS